MEIGLVSLADLTPDPHTDRPTTAEQRIREIVRAGQLADEAGLDVFAVGEHRAGQCPASSRSRTSRRRTLPICERGRSSTITTRRGTL